MIVPPSCRHTQAGRGLGSVVPMLGVQPTGWRAVEWLACSVQLGG